MKKPKKTSIRTSRKAKGKPRRTSTTKIRAARKRAAPRASRASARKSRQIPARASVKAGSGMQAHSAAKMAAGVLSRRAAKAEAQSPSTSTAKMPQKAVSAQAASASARQPRNSSARHGRARTHGSGGSHRPGVKIARMPQFNYMKAPDADSGFNVGDGVEVLCDHELEGERIRGWIKGVVVQVDNKLVAVQFRSNVFLTDGWMVPDRILWYSVGSDQIRNSAAHKRATRMVVPEF